MRLSSLAAVLALAGALAPGPAAAAGSRYPLELTLGHDSNVANAREGGNEREALFALVAGGGESVWPITPGSALATHWRIEGQAFEQYAGLASLKARLGGRLLGRPGQGFWAPTLALGAAGAWQEFDSRARDAAEGLVTGSLQQPLTTRLHARLALQSTWRSADESAFDARQRSVALDLDWMPARDLAIYAGGQWREGDFTVNAPAVGPALAGVARAVAADDVFAGEFAVRQPGEARIATLGVNLALGPSLGVDLMARHVEAESALGVRYRRTQAFLSLLARF